MSHWCLVIYTPCRPLQCACEVVALWGFVVFVFRNKCSVSPDAKWSCIVSHGYLYLYLKSNR